MAFRNISRKKLYTIINLTGLSIASAFCILVYWYLQHENSFDTFHKDAHRLYRLEFSQFSGPLKKESKAGFFSLFMKDADQQNLIQTPVIFAGELKKDFPEIENAVRIMPGYEIIVRVNNQSFKEEGNSAFVEEDFFTVFNFPLLKGSAAKALSEKNQLVISEKAAKKYFGNDEPLGKTILLPTLGNAPYTVSAVAKDFPANSSFHYDLIMSRESVPDYAESVRAGLNSFSDLLILKLKEGTNATVFEKKLDDFGKQYFQVVLKEWASHPGSETKPENFHVYLRPFADCHFNASAGWEHYTDLKNIYQLASLAILILLIACLNYILLTLTGTLTRSGEVGIRKTVGAPRKQIIFQFYTETQLFSLISVIIGLLLAVFCLPLFNILIGDNLQFTYFSFTSITLLLIGLAVLLGLLAGIYPALIMSGIKPLKMMRKFSAYRLNPYFSKALIVTQFSVCIILILSSIVISRQLKFLDTAELGFDKDQVAIIQNPYGFDNLEKAYQLRDRLYHYTAREPSIENITTNGFPFSGYNNTSNHLINGNKTMVQGFDIDYNYFSFFKIPITKGRSFSSAIKSDSASIEITSEQRVIGSSAARKPIVVNETLYKLLGHPPLNIFNREMGGLILGVCKDYHSDDLTKPISPAYHRIFARYIGSFMVKIKSGQNLPNVMGKLKSNWSVITGNEPFSFTFLDQNVQKSYDTYLRWMQTITTSCLLAILIASLGLFGLSGLTAINRIKEIGIRKVLGASVSNLFILLNKSTLYLAMLSFIIAIPIAFYFINTWLQNFAYHINPGITTYLLAGIISIGTALIAVSYHTIKTANANPVKSLRSE